MKVELESKETSTAKKMRIRFIKDDVRKRYPPLNLRDGDTVEVPDEKGEELIKALPDNFEEVDAQGKRILKPLPEIPKPRVPGNVIIRFKRTTKKKAHGSRGIFLKDGDTAEVSPNDADHCLKHWPDNFEKLSASQPFTKQGPPLTKLTSTPLVSILIPQRGRAKQVTKSLELILSNTTYPNYEVILICDRDDLDSVSEIPQDKRIKTIVDPSPKRQMFVGKINYGFRVSKAEYIVYLANDVEVSKNWLTEAMKAMLGAFPNGMGLVGFNHGKGGKHAFHGLTSRKFVDSYLGGNILYPKYVHFWSDIELLNIVKKLNKFHFCPTSKVIHISPKDTLHSEAWENTYESGHELLLEREKMGFPVHQPRKMSDITVVTLHHWTEEILKKDLLSYLPPEIEYLQFDNRSNVLFQSAAEGFNHGIKKAKNDIVMCVHEDTKFKKEWFENFIEQESKLRNWGAIGIVGVNFHSPWHHWGWKNNAPCLAQTLDECCIIINKKNNIWFDEKTFDEWHCYAVDFCLQARDKGLDIYIMNGPAFHDDGPKSYSLPKGFIQDLARYKKVLHKKWGDKFPKIMTTTGQA